MYIELARGDWQDSSFTIVLPIIDSNNVRVLVNDRYVEINLHP